MSDVYLELLGGVVDDEHDIAGYVVRALSVHALAELAADLVAADEEGRDVADVLAVWELIRG